MMDVNHEKRILCTIRGEIIEPLTDSLTKNNSKNVSQFTDTPVTNKIKKRNNGSRVS